MAGWAKWLAFIGSAPANYIIPALGLLGFAAFALLEFASIKERRRMAAPELSSPALTPAERLNKALSESFLLRERAVQRPNEKPALCEDPLYRWAERTYRLIREHYPVYADRFYGPDASIDPDDFYLAFAYETQDHGRHDYLEQRITLLREVVAKR